MIILFVVFVLQFSVSCACLALNKDQQVGVHPLSSLWVSFSEDHSGFLLQNHLLEAGWNRSEATQKDVEKSLNCCGFSAFNPSSSCAAVSERGGLFVPTPGCM